MNFDSLAPGEALYLQLPEVAQATPIAARDELAGIDCLISLLHGRKGALRRHLQEACPHHVSWTIRGCRTKNRNNGQMQEEFCCEACGLVEAVVEGNEPVILVRPQGPCQEQYQIHASADSLRPLSPDERELFRSATEAGQLFESVEHVLGYN